jgi:hypothetical protein
MAKAKPTENPAKNAVPFRFYDNQEKYLLFVTMCSEKTKGVLPNRLW